MILRWGKKIKQNLKNKDPKGTKCKVTKTKTDGVTGHQMTRVINWRRAYKSVRKKIRTLTENQQNMRSDFSKGEN